MNTENPTVKFAWLVPSYACNKQCGFCYNGKELLQDRSIATPSTIERIVSLLTDLQIKHCTILGGEPLIYEHLEFTVQKILQAGMKVSIVTNGLVFSHSPDKLEWLENYPIEDIQVSLEPQPTSLLPVITEAERVIESLSLLPALPIQFVIKLFRNSISGIPRLMKGISKSSHRRILISFGTSIIPGDEDYEEHLLDPLELADIYMEIEAIATSLGLNPDYYMNLPLCLFSKEFIEKVVPDGRANFGCSLLRGDSIIIDHYGQISQCTHFLPISSTNVFADKSRTDLDSVKYDWQYGTVARTRELLSVARHEICLDCQHFRKKCWGGCPIIWSHFDPSTYIGTQSPISLHLKADDKIAMDLV